MLRPLAPIVIVAGLAAGCASTQPSLPAAPTPASPADFYTALDRTDLTLATALLQKTLEQTKDGESAGWRNPASGRSGTVKPTRSFVTSNGYFCRAYDEEMKAPTGSKRFRHEACRNEDGVWVWL